MIKDELVEKYKNAEIALVELDRIITSNPEIDQIIKKFVKDGMDYLYLSEREVVRSYIDAMQNLRSLLRRLCLLIRHVVEDGRFADVVKDEDLEFLKDVQAWKAEADVYTIFYRFEELLVRIRKVIEEVTRT